VRSFIFGVLGVNRFMTGQIWLGVLKLALFLAHIIFIIVIAGAAIDAIGAATTNQDVQNAVVIIGANSFIISILGLVITIWWFVDLFITGSAVRKQNLEKILKAIDEQA
jgi:TM2 domain